MKKLEASARDRSAKTWRERKVMYRVGSYFKGCANCGETEYVEVGSSGRSVLRYLSGYQVFRSYQPSASGFTYWCWECGAKDLRCWGGATDIGKDAVVGSRDAVRSKKLSLRKENTKLGAGKPSLDGEIARLEGELARLMEILKKGGN